MFNAFVGGPQHQTAAGWTDITRYAGRLQLLSMYITMTMHCNPTEKARCHLHAEPNTLSASSRLPRGHQSPHSSRRHVPKSNTMNDADLSKRPLAVERSPRSASCHGDPRHFEEGMHKVIQQQKRKKWTSSCSSSSSCLHFWPSLLCDKQYVLCAIKVLPLNLCTF